MDVTSLYTNIPQEEGISTVCEAYEDFNAREPSRNAKSDSRNLVPIQWERLPPNSWNSHGNENDDGRSFC